MDSGTEKYANCVKITYLDKKKNMNREFLHSRQILQ